jgi:hypothetical protein
MLTRETLAVLREKNNIFFELKEILMVRNERLIYEPE